jgi:hypothetical protein
MCISPFNGASLQAPQAPAKNLLHSMGLLKFLASLNLFRTSLTQSELENTMALELEKENER